jgi:TRAP-type uncharacterized transport system substrate-binding protein
MTAMLRHTLLSVRDLLLTAGPFIAVSIVLLALAYLVLDPQPPRRVVLATGPAQSAYAEFGTRYQRWLHAHGIEVELRGTQGSAENLKLLRDPSSGVDLAFVQGGSSERTAGADGDDEPLVSLGSLFLEPVWLFYRTDAAERLLHAPTLTNFSQLTGWHLNVGTPGSGVPQLVRHLLDANRIDRTTLTLEHLEQTPSVMALIEGRIDALVFASAPQSLMVQMLLQTPGIALLDVAQSEAYARRFAFLAPATLPRGVVDLARDLPPQDVHLVAPTATLVARRDIHPALVQLFVQAAHDIHGGAGWFRRKGEFPNAQTTELPLAKEAERYYRNGPPLLQHWLPFWLANLVDRMWPALAALAAVLIPLSRTVPPLYEFRVRSRIFRWYGQLRTIEAEVGVRAAGELQHELERVERQVQRLRVPLSHADELYALRTHIRMVGERLRGGAVARDAAAATRDEAAA